MIEKTISHYRILEKLGEGGMGIVYKAEDTKLKRIVALKFLSAIAFGGEDKSRFLREAQAAAALNHPNICTIYAIDEVDGQMFIAMEFIEGQSLLEKIASGMLQVASVIDIAKQIAEGLQAAHEKGITHRDIKSANVMITKKGQVKIMDFGLAKLSRGGTMLTKEGMTLGTAAYMSPEQARGEVVDHRTDIWSLGVVLYEMISGRLPFRGEYEAAMMYSILNEEPEPLTSLRSNVPMDLERVVAKMLAKNPATRYQHVDELPVDLTAIATTSVNKTKILPQTVQTGALHKIQPSRGNLFPWGIAAAAVLGLLVLAVVHLQQVSPEVHPIRFTIPIPSETTTMSFPYVSPDGRKIAFYARDTLGKELIWVRDLDAYEAYSLPGTEQGGASISWSPDSRFMAFFDKAMKLKKIAASGGSAQTICETSADWFSATCAWGSSGLILFSPTDTEALYQVSASGGIPIRATTLDTLRRETGHQFPHFLPDGRHFLFTVRSSQSKNRGLYIGSLDAKETRRILDLEDKVFYSPPGYLIFTRDAILTAQPFNANNFKLEGEAFSIGERPVALDFGGIYSVSHNGVLAYSSAVDAVNQLVWFDRQGHRGNVIGEPGMYFEISLSPDEKFLAIVRSDPQKDTFDLWLLELSRQIFSRFTLDPADDLDPRWSPDGRHLVFASNRKGKFDLFQKSLSGGEKVLLLESSERKNPDDYTKDGRYIIYRTRTGGNPSVWALPLVGDRQPIPVMATPFTIDESQVSPDGKWIAYNLDETGRAEVYIQPFLASGERIRISKHGGGQPKWRKDGKELFYLALDGTMMAVEIKTGAALEPGAPQPLFQTRINVNPGIDQYAVTGDGQRFIVITPAEGQKPTPFNIVLNWMAELKKK